MVFLRVFYKNRGKLNLERKNILLILIIIILIIGIGIGVTLYEQQQVKKHLTIANNYHTELMALNPQLVGSSSSLNSTINATNIAKPISANELTELRAADNIFASSAQIAYINACIEINTDNQKIMKLDLEDMNTTDISKIYDDATSIKDIESDAQTATQTRALL